jgi:copper chaperone CopZ
VKTIHHALSVLPGVEAVLTDVLTKTVHLKYDPNQLSPETIEAQLGNAGYTIAR